MRRRWHDYVPITWAELSIGIAVVLILIAITACQGIGATAPQNVSETLGAGYATATTVSHDIQHAVTTKAISTSQARAMLANVDRALLLLDTARLAYAPVGGSDPDAPRALRLAQEANAILAAMIETLKRSE